MYSVTVDRCKVYNLWGKGIGNDYGFEKWNEMCACDIQTSEGYLLKQDGQIMI